MPLHCKCGKGNRGIEEKNRRAEVTGKERKETIRGKAADKRADKTGLTQYGLNHDCIGHTYAIKYGEAYIGVILLGEAIPWETDPKEMGGDTNIPCDLLWQISDYSHVAIMLSPQAMSAERFFDREDPEKQFLLSVIKSCPDPDAALKNFRECIARVNSPERYNAFANSGFYTLTRTDDGTDTKEEMLAALAKHFGLEMGE